MTGFASVMCSDDILQVGFGHLPSSDLEECAYDSSHHVTQETIGSYEEVRFVISFSNPLRLAYIADSRLDVCMYAAERRKVLFAEQ